MLKSWRLALKTLNSYLPSLDCKNMDQNSWLNFLSCGFQAPALVSPLAAQGRTFLLRDILSWVCLPGEQGKKEEKSRMLSCKLAQTSGFLSCHGQCVGQEAACTPPQNFSAQSQDTSSEHLYTAFKDNCSQRLINFPHFETSPSLGTFCRITVEKKNEAGLWFLPIPQNQNLFSMAYHLRSNFKSKSGGKYLTLLLFLF